MQILEAVVYQSAGELYSVVDKDLWPQDIEWPFALDTGYGVISHDIRYIGSYVTFEGAKLFADRLSERKTMATHDDGVQKVIARDWSRYDPERAGRKRAYADYQEHVAFLAGYGDGYWDRAFGHNTIEEEFPNAYAAGYWEGVADA